MRENLAEVLEEIPNAESYSIDFLITRYNQIAALNSELNGVGYKPEWTTTTCRLIDILRSEYRRPQRVADWQRAEERRQQELKNSNR